MKQFKVLFTSLLFVLLTGILANASTQQEFITLTLPGSVLNKAIHKTLPLKFPVQSQTLVGSVSIDKIEKLKLMNNKLSSTITLSGHKLNLVTNIAGHDIRLNIGTLTMSFQCHATTRFDASTQTLYIRPTITGIQSGDNQKADIASALALLFNNREFPLQIERLRPIMADTGNKILNISMNIANVQLQPNAMQLAIIPRIDAANKVANKQKKRN